LFFNDRSITDDPTTVCNITDLPIKHLADLHNLQKAGCTLYRFVSTLDPFTCPVCGALDGKAFKIGDAVTGVNLPPMHIQCRCCVVIVFTDEEMQQSTRFARDADGNPSRCR
jgi:hypothetical protein